MIRLTKRMEDGSYQYNNDINFGGENSYNYKNAIIERCGIFEDFLDVMLQTEAVDTDLMPENLKNRLLK